MKIIFMGTPDFASFILEEIIAAGHEVVLCVTQPDKPRGRSGALAPSPVKEVAVKHNIPVFQPIKMREPQAIEELKRYPADIGVVAAFGQLLPKEVLDHPTLGCVNVHASLLPEYRGAAPIQWSILDGKSETGVTIMQMGVRLDDGDILSQSRVPITEETTGGSLFDELAEDGARLLLDTLPKLERGEITPIPQDESKMTKVGMISKEDGRIDFSRDAAAIERQTRGLDPWPSAFTQFGGKLFKIWKSRVLSDEQVEGACDMKPGEYTVLDRTRLVFKCGKECLEVLECQPEGKKRMTAMSYVAGHIGNKV